MSSTAKDSIVTPWALLQLARDNSFLEGGADFPEEVTRHSASDLQRVATLGNGAFCDVSLVISRSEKKQLAMKQLNQSKTRSTSQFITASTDLLTEAYFLSQLDHEHIVSLRGVSGIYATPVSDSFEVGTGGFFFTMDVMGDTLKERIERWRNDGSSNGKRKGLLKLFSKKQEKLELLAMYDRIRIGAFGVAKAMDHIHQQGILHRDLKPSNIGFNLLTGRVCVFDFGFASKLTDCRSSDICGSPRYMAPEVMRGQGYSLKSDVYSFGVVLYEIVSLKREWLPRRASTGGKHGLPRQSNFSFRPSLKKTPCQDVANLIEDCWCSDPALRPSFKDLIIAIGGVLQPETEKKSLKIMDRSNSMMSLTSIANTFAPSEDFGLPYQDVTLPLEAS